MTTVEDRVPEIGLIVDVDDESPEPRRRHSPRWYIGMSFVVMLLLVVSFCVYEFLLSAIVNDRSQRILLEEFRALTQGGPASTLEWRPVEGDPVAILTIPRIGLQVVVVEGTSSSQTTRGPGHYRPSVLPGRPGNSVIAGRRTTFGAPFGSLAKLRHGDTISVATGVGQFTYVVDHLAFVHAGATDVMNPSEDNRLTLVTSSPAYQATSRLAIVASLRTAPAPQTLDPAPAIPESEIGLTGEPEALASLLLWAEALVLLAVAAVYVSRRVSPRIAWLFGTPIALALLWAVFGSVNRLLPATF
jgi:sortase A